MSAPAVGLLTGWGAGAAALPADAARAAAGRAVIALDGLARDGDRFRRATREGLLAVAAVEAALEAAGLPSQAVRGPDTALVYVTAAAYGASNRAFVQAAPGTGTLEFPYTAPSAVPAEVAIAFGCGGPYVTLIGGAVATLEALWQAARLLARGACRRALVLAVETFAECEDLWRRGRRLVGGPLVEAAACAVVEPGAPEAPPAPAAAPAPLEVLARQRAGETLACAPLVALALAGAAGITGPIHLSGQWRGRRAALVWRA